MQLPYPPLKWALILLRVTTALLFMAHATARIAYGTIPQFAKFMSSQGFPYPGYWVWAITLAELVSGTAMIHRPACPREQRLSAGHRHRWYRPNPLAFRLVRRRSMATGGSEYSIASIVMLLVVAAIPTATLRFPQTKNTCLSQCCLPRPFQSTPEKRGARFDQPGAVATASLIDCNSFLRRSGCKCGIEAAAQNAAGSHGRASAPTRRSYRKR